MASTLPTLSEVRGAPELLGRQRDMPNYVVSQDLLLREQP